MLNNSHKMVLTCAVMLHFSCMWVSAWADATIDFQKDIRPILAEHCFQCHGPDSGARQAGLRLDQVPVSQSLSGDGQTVIVPGNPSESVLLKRVSSSNPAQVMPPIDQQNALSEDQISRLTRWIAQGANSSGHWAFREPHKKDLVAHDDEAKNPIDILVREKLHEQGMQPAVRAPYSVLCRRIYLDLVGLPPAPHEMDAFVSAAEQDCANAVSLLVDELLKSPHYGEKWARHWLDVARYADTNGYEKDLARDQWAWRDWVIEAINNDLPYDQFVRDQIAGDLIPNRNQNQLVATGFLRNGMVNEEGAIVPEQFRMEGIFDRMDCIGKAVLGLSLQCAQCHSHKFDPITQDEYYGIFSFLNDTYEAQSWVYTPEQLQAIDTIGKAIEEQNETAKSMYPDWKQRLIQWESEQRSDFIPWKVLDPQEAVWVGGVNHPVELDDHSVMVLGHPTTTGEMYLIAQPTVSEMTGLRLEALTHGDLPYGGPGRSFRGTFAITELSVEYQCAGEESWNKIDLAEVTTDFAEKESILEGKVQEGDTEVDRRVGPIAFLVDGKESTAWRADRGPRLRHTDSVAVVPFKQPLSLPEGSRLKVLLVFKHSAPGDGRQTTQLGRMRLAETGRCNPVAAQYDYAAALAMAKPDAIRSQRDHEILFSCWRQSVVELEELNETIMTLQSQYPEARTSVLTVRARTKEDYRSTYLLERGSWENPSHPVSPHVPAVLHTMSKPDPDRLEFAHWLTDRRSPLTSRVQVNRVWQAIFGTGLVETSEDFGTRAPQPRFMELLDWMAVEFMDKNWSNKQLIRTIVNSKTYQQSSRITAQQLEKDPRNRWLARGPRFRVDAEVVRDIALSVAGILNRDLGGPSTYPPVPDSVLQDTFSPPKYWKTPEDSQRYRRAVYLFRKRSMPDPALTTFDAPNADLSCVRRVRSNTPLASLVSLNEPIFVEAARAFALRVLREGGPDDEQRSVFAFRLCTGRLPTMAERDALQSLLSNRRKQLSDGWLSINEVATGDSTKLPMIPEGTTPQDAAAWTITARVLLNLDETLTKN